MGQPVLPQSPEFVVLINLDIYRVKKDLSDLKYIMSSNKGGKEFIFVWILKPFLIHRLCNQNLTIMSPRIRVFPYLITS